MARAPVAARLRVRGAGAFTDAADTTRRTARHARDAHASGAVLRDLSLLRAERMPPPRAGAEWPRRRRAPAPLSCRRSRRVVRRLRGHAMPTLKIGRASGREIVQREMGAVAHRMLAEE